ncbi:MAG: hypothetical protein PHH54_01760 [Candidatus Nanoarchaeia archaeon]|nr:hypothetical protein [Candidatus Nanoarchaeia archaeon]MDD5740688.1 hypothetical protein [Candidatus Nanoarchaeia archaeon]
MDNITTIQLSKETKDKISSFGVKGESYDEILKRIYSLAVKEQLRDFLMSSEGFISIDEAIEKHNKKWQK